MTWKIVIPRFLQIDLVVQPYAQVSYVIYYHVCERGRMR